MFSKRVNERRLVSYEVHFIGQRADNTLSKHIRHTIIKNISYNATDETEKVSGRIISDSMYSKNDKISIQREKNS
jgi:hypothetical protein